jgi:predicted nucleic acid-binding protein
VSSVSPNSAAVVDTMVVSALVDPDRTSIAAAEYRALIGARPIVVSFITVAELRYGALKARWGELRRRALERDLAQLVVVQPDDELVKVFAELRARCEFDGHALGSKIHEADRWIAATALRLGIPLISDDGIYGRVDGLGVESRRRPPP